MEGKFMLFSEGLTKSGRKTDVALTLTDKTLRTDYYNAIVVSTLLYGFETWPMAVANRKRLEAAHHRWLRRIYHDCVIPRQNHKQKYKEEDGTGGYGEHDQE